MDRPFRKLSAYFSYLVWCDVNALVPADLMLILQDKVVPCSAAPFLQCATTTSQLASSYKKPSLPSLSSSHPLRVAERSELHYNMKSTVHDHAIGVALSSVPYASGKLQGKQASLPDTLSLCRHSPSYGSSRFGPRKVSVIDWMSRFSKKADSYAQSIRDHVSLAPKISDTVKGKLRLGTRILQAGGIEKVFRRSFSVGKGEKLLKAFQCYLSTTAGPIAGLLFVSTEKIAFHSDRSLMFTSSKGESARVPYKVVIPLRRIMKASPSENTNKPNQKYIQIVTVDGFEFWFMGLLSYQRSFKYLQQAILEAHVRISQKRDIF